jgi:hypothetical protein
VHAHDDDTYGSPHMTTELRRRGYCVNHRRTARLMRRAGLEGRCTKRWRKTTVPDPAAWGQEPDWPPLRTVHPARSVLRGRHHLFWPALGYARSVGQGEENT